jgi:hypothetical protein
MAGCCSGIALPSSIEEIDPQFASDWFVMQIEKGANRGYGKSPHANGGGLVKN